MRMILWPVLLGCALVDVPKVQASRFSDYESLNSTFGETDVSFRLGWFASNDTCSWTGVTCNGNGSVVAISLISKRIVGRVNLSALPSSLQSINLQRNTFSGNITNLPTNLRSITLDLNQFSGTLNLTSLPLPLEIFSIFQNSFSGSVDLTSLPPNLTVLNLRRNQLTGTVDVTRLPRKLATFSINQNSFSGTLNLSSTPRSLVIFTLSSNSFSGAFDFAALPNSIEQLEIQSNKFNSEFNSSALGRSLQVFYASTNNLHGSLDISGLPKSLRVFSISGNSMNGTLDLTLLPRTLTHFWVDSNKFSGTLDFSLLPPQLASLHVRFNSFSGSLQLEHFPRSLSDFQAASNKFSGSLNMSRLATIPMFHLAINSNDLSGSFNTALLPRSMFLIQIQENQFSGSFDFTSLPPNVVILDMHTNLFSGKFAPVNTSSIFSLRAHGNRFSGSLDTSSIPRRLTTLTLEQNSFEGTIDWPKMPSTVGSILLANNKFSGTIDIAKLSSAVNTFSVPNNQFSGTIDWNRLPSSLQQFDVTGNMLQGNVTIDVSKLPRSLPLIYIARNRFQGVLNVFGATTERRTIWVAGCPLSSVNFSAVDPRVTIIADRTVPCTPSVYCKPQLPISLIRSDSFCTGKTECEQSCGKCSSMPPTKAPTFAPTPTVETSLLMNVFKRTSLVANASNLGWFNTFNPCRPAAWHGINCSSNRDNVIAIDLSGQDLAGWIDLNFLPTKLVRLNLSHNRLLLSADVQSLPHTLISLDLSANPGISGAINFLNASTRIDVRLSRDVRCLAPPCERGLQAVSRLESNCQGLEKCIATCHCALSQAHTRQLETVRNSGTALLIVVSSVFGVLIVASFVSSKSVAIYKSSDAPNFRNVAMFFLNVADFWSDVLVTISRGIDVTIYGDAFLVNIFVALLVFVAVPYVLSFGVLVYQVNRWQSKIYSYEVTTQWMDKHKIIVILLSSVSGSVYAAVKLVTSRLYPKFELFYFSFPEEESVWLTKLRFFNVVLLENVPQVAIQLLYVTWSKAHLDGLTLISLGLSVVSFLNSTIAQVIEFCGSDNNPSYHKMMGVQCDVSFEFQDKDFQKHMVHASKMKLLKGFAGGLSIDVAACVLTSISTFVGDTGCVGIFLSVNITCKADEANGLADQLSNFSDKHIVTTQHGISKRLKLKNQVSRLKVGNVRIIQASELACRQPNDVFATSAFQRLGSWFLFVFQFAEQIWNIWFCFWVANVMKLSAPVWGCFVATIGLPYLILFALSYKWISLYGSDMIWVAENKCTFWLLFALTADPSISLRILALVHDTDVKVEVLSGVLDETLWYLVTIFFAWLPRAVVLTYVYFETWSGLVVGYFGLTIVHVGVIFLLLSTKATITKSTEVFDTELELLKSMSLSSPRSTKTPLFREVDAPSSPSHDGLL